MLDDAARWLQEIAPALDAYEMSALHLMALGLTAVLLVLSLLALARAGRLLSETQAIALKTVNLEKQNLRLNGEIQALRERIQLVQSGETPRPVSPSPVRSRKVARSKPVSPYQMRRGAEPRPQGSSIH